MVALARDVAVCLGSTAFMFFLSAPNLTEGLCPSTTVPSFTLELLMDPRFAVPWGLLEALGEIFLLGEPYCDADDFPPEACQVAFLRVALLYSFF